MLKSVGQIYTESSYTPTWGGGTVTVNSARYVQIGNLVTVFFDVVFGASISSADSDLSLPTSGAVTWGTGSINFTDYGVGIAINIDPTSEKILFRSADNAGNLTRTQMAGKRVIASASYISQ
jgi:hypothetical protein